MCLAISRTYWAFVQSRIRRDERILCRWVLFSRTGCGFHLVFERETASRFQYVGMRFRTGLVGLSALSFALALVITQEADVTFTLSASWERL